jgi:hypothetical protein
LSAVLVPLPFLAAWSAHVWGWVINIVVASLVGGPHLFSTVLDARFRAQHPRYLAAALTLPLLVLYLGMTQLRPLPVRASAPVE